MDVFDRLAALGVVPVIALDEAAAAVPLADALLEGGLPVAEITFRTEAAAEAIAAMAGARPEMLVGAGTVLSEKQADAALAAGARFALAPGLDAAVLAHASRIGLPFAPGIMTPSDLQVALRAGCRFVKFFPAGPSGGPKMLRAVAGPYAHTGIGFNPTGGVTLDTLSDWLAMTEVRAVGGSWIATREDIAAGDWTGIAAKARAAVAKVAELRDGQGSRSRP
jgi:2-dehydro-3-deoxyphosphogluconate aldolase/(4S)-4-hydroxy-2-oxoglutarate aldolase